MEVKHFIKMQRPDEEGNESIARNKTALPL